MKPDDDDHEHLLGSTAERALLAAQGALATSHERMRGILDSITDGVIVVDDDARLIWLNQRARELLQPAPAPDGALVGRVLWEAFPDLAGTVLEQQYRRAVADQAAVRFELHHDRLDRWFEVRASPSAGTLTAYFHDTTQRKRDEQALIDEARTLELLNETGQALASKLEMEPLVQAITDAATKLSGAKFGAFFYTARNDDNDVFTLYTLSGAPREAFDRFGHPRATALFGPTFHGAGPIRVDDVLKDGRYGKSSPHHGMPPGHLPVRSYLAVGVRSRSGDIIGGLFFGHPEPGVFTERSERLMVAIAAQASVAMDNAALFKAAQRATAERERLLDSERSARVEVERASRMKDEFLSILSHELRTPLTAILGWSNVLQSKSTDEAVLRGLATIERNARMQNQLIEDLLDMSRITSGKLRLDVQPIDPVGFIDAAIETVKPAAIAKDIRIEKVLDPAAGPLHGDTDRLQQVVWNLVSNAIKFTPRGGTVEVHLARVAEALEIRVVDTGQGIHPEFLPFVFDRFRQADSSSTRRHGGLGLGLSIVKHLVELHGGTVEVRSEGANRGATFVVQLPVAAVRRRPPPVLGEPGAAAAPALSPRDLDGVTVVVVDDEEDARELVRSLLTMCGASVFTAGTAAEAIALVEDERPDVLVSDIGMPEVDGYELLKRVRALGASRNGRVPAIALTAFARTEDRTRSLRAGFLVHVSKPVEAAELVATVASVAGRAG